MADPAKDLFAATDKDVTNSAGPADTPVQPKPLVRDVTKEETVSGQMETLKNSPFVQQARGRAKQDAARMGLANSSIAAQAGEQAAISSFLPIAQQDADTFSKAATQNTETRNLFNLEAFKRETAKDLSQQEHQQRLEQSGVDYYEQLGLLARDFTNTQKLSEQEQVELKEITEINHENTLAQIAKTGEVDTQLMRDRVDAELAANTEFAETQSALRQVEMEVQGQIDIINRLEEIAAQEAAEGRLQGHQNQLNLIRDEQQHLQNLELERDRLNNRLAEIESETVAQMSIDSARSAQSLSAQYLSDTGAAMRQAQQAINNIAITEGLSASQQQAAINDVRTKLVADLELLQTYYQGSPYWDPSIAPDAGGAPASGEPGTGGTGTTASGEPGAGGTGTTASGEPGAGGTETTARPQPATWEEYYQMMADGQNPVYPTEPPPYTGTTGTYPGGTTGTYPTGSQTDPVAEQAEENRQEQQEAENRDVTAPYGVDRAGKPLSEEGWNWVQRFGLVDENGNNMADPAEILAYHERFDARTAALRDVGASQELQNWAASTSLSDAQYNELVNIANRVKSQGWGDENLGPRATEFVETLSGVQK